MNGKGEDVVHHVTDPMEIIMFVPFTEFDNDHCVNGKWATILSSLPNAWEIGHNNVYALQ